MYLLAPIYGYYSNFINKTGIKYTFVKFYLLKQTCDGKTQILNKLIITKEIFVFEPNINAVLAKFNAPH